jgi:hypothetical protein
MFFLYVANAIALLCFRLQASLIAGVNFGKEEYGKLAAP